MASRRAIGAGCGVLALAGVAATVGGRVAVDSGVATAIVFAAGVGVLVLSFVLFGFTTFVTGVLPRGAATLLVLGTLLLAVFNFGDARIWLGVPFGLAWLWLGYALWSLRGAGLDRVSDGEAPFDAGPWATVETEAWPATDSGERDLAEIPPSSTASERWSSTTLAQAGRQYPSPSQGCFNSPDATQPR